MVLTDRIILPAGCILCGILMASSGFLRLFPRLGPAVLGLLPLKAPIGTLTLMAGLLSLFFPADGPALFASLFPSLIGIASGAFLILDLLLEFPLLRRYKRQLSWIGNAMLYARNPLGWSSFGLGVLHLCFAKAPFF
jgi:hypothetical protein